VTGNWRLICHDLQLKKMELCELTGRASLDGLVLEHPINAQSVEDMGESEHFFFLSARTSFCCCCNRGVLLLSGKCAKSATATILK